MTIFLIALAVFAAAVAWWFIRAFADGRKLRREADEWRSDLARQREIHRTDDETRTWPTMPPGGGA